MAPAPIDSANTNHVTFILNVLSHAEDLRVDWNGVATDNKIGYAKNASSKFSDTVKKYGYSFKNRKLTKIDEDDADIPADAVPKTPAKRTKKDGGEKLNRSAKKRKTAQLPEDDGKEKDVKEENVSIEDVQIDYGSIGVDGYEDGEQD